MASSASRTDEWEWRPGRLLEDASDEVIFRRLFSSRVQSAIRSRGQRAAHRRKTVAQISEKLRALPQPERKVSLRVGEVDGYPTRTFFLRVEPAKKAGALARYTHRLQGVRDEELESKGGLPAEIFEQRATALESVVPPSKAKAYSAVIELPYETTPEIRADIMDMIAAYFSQYAPTWAVHSHNSKGASQPHGHLMYLAGPRGERALDGSEAMRDFRAFVANTVNSVSQARTGCRLPREWHGGTLADTGISRAPKPDIHRGLYRAREKRDALLKAGKVVPERLMQLAAAADRIEAHHARIVEAGKPAEPQGMARRKARLTERRELLTHAAKQQEDLRHLEQALEAVEQERHAQESQLIAQREAAISALDALSQELAVTQDALCAATSDRAALEAEIAVLRDVTIHLQTAAEAAQQPPAEPPTSELFHVTVERQQREASERLLWE